MKDDVLRVKELADAIGYGYLMCITSALWRDLLKENGYPTSGAFVPSMLKDIKDENQKGYEVDIEFYDKYRKRILYGNNN